MPSDKILSGIEAVLFDLDGTLIDTAPDMVAVLSKMLCDHDRQPVDYAIARSTVSNGALGLVSLGFPDADDIEHKRFYNEYLDRYEQAICMESCVFPGLVALLENMEAEGRPWGIVTNKPRRMTDPLLAALGLTERASCAISGDTLPQRKPDPAPLLYASDLIRVAAKNIVYVGDARRDIQAGQSAGMRTIAAAYGYIVSGDDPLSWNADLVAHETSDLTHMLTSALTEKSDA